MSKLTIDCSNKIEKAFNKIVKTIENSDRSWYLGEENEEVLNEVISQIRDDLDWLEENIEVERNLI